MNDIRKSYFKKSMTTKLSKAGKITDKNTTLCLIFHININNKISHELLVETMQQHNKK